MVGGVTRPREGVAAVRQTRVIAVLERESVTSAGDCATGDGTGIAVAGRPQKEAISYQLSVISYQYTPSTTDVQQLSLWSALADN